MKLLLNTTSLMPPLTGIGNYTLNLLQQFNEAPDIEQIYCFNGRHWQLAEELLAARNTSDDKNCKSKFNPYSYRPNLRKLIRSLPFSYSLNANMINRNFNKTPSTISSGIYHEPSFILKSNKFPAVVNIHDLSFIHHPEYHPRQRVQYLLKELPKTLKHADIIITDSNLVREELLQRYQLDEDKVKAIYLGVDPRFKPRSSEEINPYLKKYNLGFKQYIFYVGTIEPRKGVDVLLASWRGLPKKIREHFPLVIAGSPGWSCAKLMADIYTLVSKGEIRYLQYVNQNDLPRLYSGAAVFLYPSHYEGFGLPVLEAMASGTTTICRDYTTMAEFASDTVITCKTKHLEEWIQKLKLILEDKELNNSLANVALIQAQQFTWKRCADATLDVYKQLL